jgi:hypothetical protein
MASVAAILNSKVVAPPEFSPTSDRAGRADPLPPEVSPQAHDSPNAGTIEDTVTLSGFAPRLPKYPVPNPLAQGQPAATPSGIASTVLLEVGQSTGPRNSADSRSGTGLDENLPSSNRAINVQPKSAAPALPNPATSLPTLSLQHLDQTLQQIGINPLTISIARREALLSLANDPSALVQYFQTAPANAALSTESSSPPVSQTTSVPPSDGKATNQTSVALPLSAHVDVSA